MIALVKERLLPTDRPGKPVNQYAEPISIGQNPGQGHKSAVSRIARAFRADDPAGQKVGFDVQVGFVQFTGAEDIPGG